MKATLRPDVCVIGAGAAGLSVAAACASFGVSVVLVERAKMGGDCLNYGCVPSKALIAAARHAEDCRRASRFGIDSGPVSVDFSRVRAHVRGAVAAIAPHDSVERFESLGVRVVKAEARFEDPKTLIAGQDVIQARRFVLATGSRPKIPPIAGLETVPYLTNETLFDNEELPAHLLIVGGGPVGIEMAQAFRRLGSEVTLIQAGRVLPREPADFGRELLELVRKEGVTVLEGARVIAAQRRGDGQIALTVDSDGTGTLIGSHLLLAAGRTVEVASLRLDLAGIKVGADGIAVGPDLRTANRRVYAIGDAVVGAGFTHLAGYHASRVVRALLFRLPVRWNREHVPRVTFTDPPIAAIGVSSQTAAERSWKTIRVGMDEVDRAVVEGRPQGCLRLVIDARGRLAGAEMIGAGADEVIALLALALGKRLSLADLASFLAPYPTICEIVRKAATAHYRPVAARPSLRALVRFLARFG